MRLLINRDLWFPVPDKLVNAKVKEMLTKCKVLEDLKEEEEDSDFEVFDTDFV